MLCQIVLGPPIPKFQVFLLPFHLSQKILTLTLKCEENFALKLNLFFSLFKNKNWKENKFSFSLYRSEISFDHFWKKITIKQILIFNFILAIDLWCSVLYKEDFCKNKKYINFSGPCDLKKMKTLLCVRRTVEIADFLALNS